MCEFVFFDSGDSGDDLWHDLILHLRGIINGGAYMRHPYVAVVSGICVHRANRCGIKGQSLEGLQDSVDSYLRETPLDTTQLKRHHCNLCLQTSYLSGEWCQ